MKTLTQLPRGTGHIRKRRKQWWITIHADGQDIQRAAGADWDAAVKQLAQAALDQLMDRVRVLSGIVAGETKVQAPRATDEYGRTINADWQAARRAARSEHARERRVGGKSVSSAAKSQRGSSRPRPAKKGTR